MLVFADECGDPGRKTNQGSSPLFAVTAVLFEDRDEALRCDESITALRASLGLSPHKEFHFSKDTDNLRREFLSHVSRFRFGYSSAVLNKNALNSPGFNHKQSLYKYAVRLAFTNIEASLSNAIVVFDQCGGRDFTLQLRNYLKKRNKEWSKADGRCRIHKVKASPSHSNNLIQMADMIGGAATRSFSSRKRPHAFRDLVRHREMRVQLWPSREAECA